MDSTSRLQQVYNALGRILSDPESFGLGKPVPELLVSAVTAMRQQLKDEMIALDRWEPDDDDLSAELSQDSV
jgi:hypothetical protein